MRARRGEGEGCSSLEDERRQAAAHVVPELLLLAVRDRACRDDGNKDGNEDHIATLRQL